MTGEDESVKIQKFHGKPTDDYHLWRIRAEAALKGKQYWKKLHLTSQDEDTKEECDEETKEKATAMLVAALGDSPLRVCQSAIGDPVKMLDLLDIRYASKRTASKISVLTTMYSKSYSSKTPMSKYIDEFASLFAQLESMGEDARLPESHKGPLLLASLGNSSPLESTVAALRLRESEELTWESVTSDLIQEYNRKFNQPTAPSSNNSSKEKKFAGKDKKAVFRGNKAMQKNNAESSTECGFCGLPGHEAENCFCNPSSPKCRLTDTAKKHLMAKKATDISDVASKRRSNSSKIQFGGYAALSTTARKTNPRCLDSGASCTMFQEPSDALPGTYKQGSSDSVQLAAGNSSSRCLGSGVIRVGDITLKDSIHVENLNGTLVSVGQLCDQGKTVVFRESEALILDTNVVEVAEDIISYKVPRASNGLYCFAEDIHVRTACINELGLWHRRLVHAHPRLVKEAHTHCEGIPQLVGDMEMCHPCALGKSTKKSFISNFESASYAGEIVHTDLAGPMPKGLVGEKYICTFQDQYTRWISVACLTRKSQTCRTFNEYKEGPIASCFPNGVKRLHSDGGTEYLTIDEVFHTTTTPYTPQHNPFAERVNRTLLEAVRTMLEEAGLSSKYWTEAIHHAAFVKNLILHSGIGMSPYEKLHGRKPNLKNMKVFGCAAFVHNEHPKNKVTSRARPGIFLGVNDYGVYRVALQSTGQIVESVHVRFDERTFPGLEKQDSSSSGEEEDDWNLSQSDTESVSFRSESNYSDDNPIPNTHTDESEAEENAVTTLQQEEDTSIAAQLPDDNREDDVSQSITKARPRRTIRLPVRYRDSGNAHHFAGTVIKVHITTSDTPSVAEALNATPPEVALWQSAILEELNALEDSDTWHYTGKSGWIYNQHGKRVRKVKTLPTHIILRIKRNEEGLPVRFKARVVAGGHCQIFGEDYSETYAPVVDFTLVRLMSAVSLQLGWYSKHIDIKNAFLNGDIDVETYVSHPVNLPQELRSNNIYRLHKALYGLHQAPLQWFLKLYDALTNELGFTQLHSDSGIFKLVKEENGMEIIVLILVYVDDLILVSNKEAALDESASRLLTKFRGTDGGPTKWYLGIDINTGDQKCTFSQSAYIAHILEKYGMDKSRPVVTPMIKNFYDEVEAHANDEVLPDNNNYRNMIGSLLFLANRTRPDISTSVGILSQYVQCPTAYLLSAIHRVFRYLNGTRNYGLVYQKSSEGLVLSAFVDADYAQDKSDRKSRSGFAAHMANCLISWHSRKQGTVSQSTAEAEYIALSECCKELKFFRLFLAEIGFPQLQATPISTDNQAAIHWADSSVSMRRAKHIDIRYHYIKECVKHGMVTAKFVSSDENIADGLTKPLDKGKFESFRRAIAVVPIEE